MAEFIVSGIIIGGWLAIAWPLLMQRREGLHNPAILRGNAHLEKCYWAWRWTTPLTFFGFYFLAMVGIHAEGILVDDGIILSLVILFLAVAVGSLVGESLGHYYKRHPERYRRRRNYRKVAA